MKALNILLERSSIMTEARVQVTEAVEGGANLFGAVNLTATLRVPNSTRPRFSRTGEH